MRKFFFLLGGLVLLVIIAMFMLVAMSPRNPSTNNSGTNSSSSSSGQTEVGTNQQPRDWEYFGIRADGALALIDKTSTEVAIDLNDENWRDPQFDPQGNAVSILAETKTNIFDLFTYNLEDRKWRRETYYGEAASGITGYFWGDDGFIYYTQGTGADNWLHRYDYENKEIRKLFRVFGSLYANDYRNDRLLFAIPVNNVTDFELFDYDGARIKAFAASDILPSSMFTAVFLPFDGNKVVLSLIAGGVQHDYVWSVDTTEYTELSYAPSNQVVQSNITDKPQLLCSFAEDLFFGRLVTNSAQAIAVINYSLGGYQLIHTWPDADGTIAMQHPRCTSDSLVWGGDIQGERKWWSATRDELNELSWAKGYKDVVGR